MKRVLAIFDFDGTLTTKDTFLELIKFQKGSFYFWLGFLRLSPIILLHLLKVIPNWRAKEYVLTHFFRGLSLKEFQAKCDEFSINSIPKLLRKDALDKFNYHLDKEHDVVVVSASAQNWLEGWCKEKNVKLIATNLEVDAECLTGKISGFNCYGPEKLVRLKKEFCLEDYEEIHVYGDSRGDREILEVASHKFYRKFYD